MSKFKVVLFNQDTLETVDDCVDGETFDTEDEAQSYIDEIHDAGPAGEECMRMAGMWDEGADHDYGYGNDDLILQVEEVDDDK